MTNDNGPDDKCTTHKKYTGKSALPDGFCSNCLLMYAYYHCGDCDRKLKMPERRCPNRECVSFVD